MHRLVGNGQEKCNTALQKLCWQNRIHSSSSAKERVKKSFSSQENDCMIAKLYVWCQPFLANIYIYIYIYIIKPLLATWRIEPTSFVSINRYVMPSTITYPQKRIRDVLYILIVIYIVIVYFHAEIWMT